MKVKIKSVKRPQTIAQAGITIHDLLKGAIPLYTMWGTVLSANSEHNTVNVELESGVELRNVEVRSLEWAGVNSIGYGERDLPPKDCPVLIIFPGGSIENGFVLCSTLNRFESKHKAELLVSGKENEHLRVREGKKTILKINGATIIVNVDGSVEIDPDSGKTINIAGDTKNFVTHAELNTALQTFLTALKAAVSSGCQSGAGGNIASVTLDISTAEATKVKTS